MSLRDHLQRIYDAHQALTPEIVLSEARDPEHPLHNRFEWDDTEAAEKWRRHQAHELITSVRVTYTAADGEPREVRAFHAVRTERGHVYEPAERVVQDELMTRVLMADMEREWRTLKRRYDHFAEFRAMVRRDLDEAA